ncbi:hypothetical protein GDO81_013147 [Engystomops pustulosus]|uniref:Uncharacterized protein n=1 Tax=Engystomops pustulosus TaxID=76066 RepID=A0AAV7AYK9_ENGPU|nr:hypothetical protein GDO81_013147 [Engystomops pustulosus]
MRTLQRKGKVYLSLQHPAHLGSIFTPSGITYSGVSIPTRILLYLHLGCKVPHNNHLHDLDFILLLCVIQNENHTMICVIHLT